MPVSLDAIHSVDKQALKDFLAKKEEVVIDDTEKYVINFAYADYVNIKKLTIGKSVKEIRNGAFFGCTKLQEIMIPKNRNFQMREDCLIQVKQSRLSLCLGAPRVPDGVEVVDLTCFLKEGEVETLHIGKDLKTVDRAVRKFNIKNISLDPENAYFKLEGNCLIERETGSIVLGCENSVIPQGAKSIGAEAFYGCNIRSVRVPASVREIEFGAFQGCKLLEEVVFEGGTSRIEDYAFADCASLAKADLPESLTFLNTYAFRNCVSLQRLPALGKLDRITDGAFAGSGLTELALPPQIEYVEENSFGGCTALVSADLGTAYDVGENAFQNCTALVRVTMSDKVKRGWPGVFRGCTALKEARLSQNLCEVGEEMFLGCASLAEIDLPESVQSVWSRAFCDCVNLQRIELKNVTELGTDAFLNCGKLPEDCRKLRADVRALPKALVSFEDFESLTECLEPGYDVELYRPDESAVCPEFRGALTSASGNYLYVTKNGQEFMVKVEDEMNEEGMYECAVVASGEAGFAELKQALAAKK